MSDWQVGDLAVCVAPIVEDPIEVARGDILSVEGVWPDVPHAVTLVMGCCLDFAGIERLDGGEAAYCAERFRKIRSDEHEACEEEFVTLLKRSRKTVRA